MLDANATGTVNTSLSAAAAPSVAPVVPKLVCPVVPVTAPQVAVPLATQVAFAVSVTPAGSGSVIVMLVATDGPPLVTVTVYVALPPGVYVALPSVLTTLSDTVALRESVSVPVAVLPGPEDARSVAVAELMIGSATMLAANATGTVKTSLLAAPAPIDALVVPKLVCPVVPVTVPQLAVPLATQVAFALSVTPAGNASVTVTFVALDGPPLVTVIVYVAVPPGVYVALPSVLTTLSDTCAESVSLSEPVAGGEAGSVAVAVLTSGFVVIAGAKDTGTVNVS